MKHANTDIKSERDDDSQSQTIVSTLTHFPNSHHKSEVNEGEREKSEVIGLERYQYSNNIV